jgi:hypothetical protein
MRLLRRIEPSEIQRPRRRNFQTVKFLPPEQSIFEILL